MLLVLSCFPSSGHSCLCPDLPQSLSVETLGPEPRMDPEPERAPQAPPSPSKADGGELAGTLDGEGNGLAEGGVQTSVLHVLGVPSFLREREVG